MNEDIRVSEIQASLILAQDRKYTRIADDYIAALNTRNPQAVGKNLHPHLQVVGPAGEVHNRGQLFVNFPESDSTFRKGGCNGPVLIE
jgi:hypothetical protein